MTNTYFYKPLIINKWNSTFIPSIDLHKNLSLFNHKFSEFIYDENKKLWFLNDNKEIIRIYNVDEDVKLDEIYYYGNTFDKVLLLSSNGLYSTVLIDIEKSNNIINKIYKEWLDLNINIFVKALELENCKKRKRDYLTLNELYKYKINLNEWISTIHMKNFIIGTPLNDILILHNFKLSYYKPDIDSIKVELFKKNIKFEESIIKELKEIIFNIVDIPNLIEICYPNTKDIYKFSNFMIVLKQIKSGIPIIYHPVLYNCIDKIYGNPDFLIKGKFINILFQTDIIEFDYYDYYFVVDIKPSKYKLSKINMDVLHNSRLIDYYKLELFTYNKILGQIQGYTPNIAFLLHKFSDNNEQLTLLKNPLCSWTLINTNIEYQKYLDSIAWVNFVRKEGKTVNLENPTRVELIPNVKTLYDSYSIKQKKIEIIEKQFQNGISNITTLWNCTERHQIQGWNNNIINWCIDDRDIPSLIGFKQDTKQYEILSLIIKMNQVNSNLDNIYFGKNIPNIFDEKYYIYVDLEFVIDTNIVYMIGVGWYNNGYKYKTYIAKNLTEESELDILNQFYKEHLEEKKPKIITWGHIERVILSKKLPNTYLNNLDTYIDLCAIFKQTPIIIRGALNFGLKSIAKALYNNNIINTYWSNFTYKHINEMDMTPDILNYLVNEYYNKLIITANTIQANTDAIEPIINYNMVDTKILWEIHFWLNDYYKKYIFG
jgi:hypothetical protein